jgi:hypothetical protein
MTEEELEQGRIFYERQGAALRAAGRSSVRSWEDLSGKEKDAVSRSIVRELTRRSVGGEEV